MLPDRAKLLFAFREETEHLTRQQIMGGAGSIVAGEFQSLLDAKLIQQDDWHPKHPNRFHLTPLGIDRRDNYRDVWSFRNG